MGDISITGKTFLHYRILEKIGEGGMGAVYKAQDTHLDRMVAIKILPQEKMSDPERKQRFILEAKAASSLNHPNIIIVHDIASDHGLDIMVLEYVEGETLDRLIGRKGMKLNDALACALQIADGLAKAHAAGIIHRDLKPANIMVTEEGRVKILDFGLAKLIENKPSVPPGSTATMDLAEKQETEEGFIMGTVAYMSPEQAEGKNIDARSDVFAFGSVLYEMLTGQKAFQRGTRMASLAAILNEEPKPAGQVNETLPSEILQALKRCLRKDPQRRWQNVSDLKVVLQDLKEDSESGKLRPPQITGRRRRRHPLLWAGLGAAVVAAAALLWIFLPKTSGPPEFEITRLTFDSGLTWGPTLSPDGTMFACSSDRVDGNVDIWLQQIAGGPALRLTTHPADDAAPSFSPEGSRVVFHSKRDGGGIYEIATLGGRARRISDFGIYPHYSPDGSWISFFEIPASRETDLNKMFLIPAQGGTPIPFQPEFCIVNTSSNFGPVWSPDGQYLIFNGRRTDDRDSLDWWVAPVSGEPAVRTFAHRSLSLPAPWRSPYSWSGSHIYYATGSTVDGVNLFRARIDEAGWTFKEPAEQITSGTGMQFMSSVHQGGLILYANLKWIANIWTLEAETNLALDMGEPVPAARDIMAKFSPSISRDGSRLAYYAIGGLKSASAEIRVKDLVKGDEKIFPMRAARSNLLPRLSPDGTMLSYHDLVEGKSRIFILDGQGSASRVVCESCVVLGFYTDSNFAFIREEGERLMRLNIATGEKSLLLEAGTGRISAPAISPDNRWISFVLGNPDGRAAIYIAPLAEIPPPEKDWILLIKEESYLGSPDWSPDGNRLYYLAERDGVCGIWTQKLDPLTKNADGEVREVYHAHKSTLSMNLPVNSGAVVVAEGKLIFWMSETTGNINMATPKRK